MAETIIIAPLVHSTLWAEFSEPHQDYIDRLWQDILAFPRVWRIDLFWDNATEMRDGGRGIYTRDERIELGTRLGIPFGELHENRRSV